MEVQFNLSNALHVLSKVLLVRHYKRKCPNLQHNKNNIMVGEEKKSGKKRLCIYYRSSILIHCNTNDIKLTISRCAFTTLQNSNTAHINGLSLMHTANTLHSSG